VAAVMRLLFFKFIQKAYENYYSIISAYSDRVSVRSFCGSSF
jgi:hypothetical protein